MFTDMNIVGIWPAEFADFRQFVGIATHIANAYKAVRPNLALLGVQMAIFNAAQNFLAQPGDAARFRDLLITEFNDDLNVPHAPPAATAVNLNPAPPPPGPPPPAGSRQKAADRQTIAAMRSAASQIAGRALANAARELEDMFHWTQRGHSEALPWEPPPSTALGKRNFALWLQSTGFQEPGIGTALNCWEAVLFSAYKARLVTKAQLLAAYMQAEAAFRQSAEPDLRTASKRGAHSMLRTDQQQRITQGHIAYLETLDARFFRSHFSVAVDPENGLIPQKGDLIMVNGDFREHIAISMGRQWVGDHSVDRVMSLWFHNAGRMAEIPLEALGDTLAYRPCPFVS